MFAAVVRCCPAPTTELCLRCRRRQDKLRAVVDNGGRRRRRGPPACSQTRGGDRQSGVDLYRVVKIRLVPSRTWCGNRDTLSRDFFCSRNRNLDTDTFRHAEIYFGCKIK